MKTNRTHLLASTFIAGLMAVAATPSFAQTAQSQTEQEQDRKEEQRATTVTDVVVTGSRIRRSEFNSTQPVQIITAEEATLEGLVDTTEILQGSTAANTAGQINNFFTGSVLEGGPGVNTLSLRGLGAQRTLVLLNGRRAGPAGARGQVGPTDLNVIPASMIERVEILTDGASSIYGSDAVAGVVNIITRKNLDGGQASVYYNQPFETGGEELNVNLGHGWRFDRGYLTASADYYERQPLLFGDRDNFACPQDVYYRDANHLIRADVIDPDTGSYKCTSYGAEMVSLYVLNAAGTALGGGIDYSPNPGAVAGGGAIGCDLNGWRQNRTFFTGYRGCALPAAKPAYFTGTQDDWNKVLRDYRGRSALHSDRYATRTAISPVRRTSINVFGGYDLTPKTELFGELLLNRRESSQNSWRQWWGLIDAWHPMNDQFDFVDDPVTGQSYEVAYIEPTLLLNSRAKQRVDYARFVGGARGQLDVGRGWDWELAVQVSRSKAEYGGNFIYNDRILAATVFDEDVDGNPVSNAQYFANLAAGCNKSFLTTAAACPTGGVDFFSPEVVGQGQMRQQDLDFIMGYEVGTTTYDHRYVEGVISGDVFDLPAGPVGAALGFQVRYEKLDDLPGEQERSGNLWGSSDAQRTVGSDTIKEVFAEFEVPLLRDLPFINSMTLNLSGRFSDYDSYGSNSTYKIGLNWAMSSAFRLRASHGTSFRAPALYEMYLGNQSSFLGQNAVDPCRSWGLSTNTTLQQNCAAQGIPDDHGTGVSSSATIYRNGGKGVLSAETADSYSVGLIWTPSFVDFNVALDYYSIEISDEVATFGAGAIVNACYLSENFPNDPFCTLFTRAPGSHPTRPYEILEVNDSFVNIASQKNEGLDLTARYRREFSFGDLTINTRASYILNWERQLFSDSMPTILNNRIGNPEWVANINARFDRNDWTVFWSMDVVPEISNSHLYASDTATYFGETIYLQRSVDAYTNHNLSVRRKFDKWTVQVGIQNLFDSSPSMVSSGGHGRVTGWGNVPRTSQYDILGRRGFVNLTRSW